MKRFLRFRLRTLLVVLTAVCLYLGWYAYTVNRQRAAVAAIKQLGGWVYYNFQVADDKVIPNPKTWEPEWLRNSLGNDFFHSVVFVNMISNNDSANYVANTQTSGAALPYIAQLKAIERLYLTGDQVTDETMHYITGLNRLHVLFLNGTSPVSDRGVAQLKDLHGLREFYCCNGKLTDSSLANLGTMPSIEGLGLQGNRFSDVGFASLKNLSNLRQLQLGFGDTHITDAGLRHLFGLKKLEHVELHGNPLSHSAVSALQNELPNASIHYGDKRSGE